MSVQSPSISARLSRRVGRILFSRGVAYALAVLAIAAGAVTFAAFFGWLPRRFTAPRFIRSLLAVDLAIVVALAGVVVVQLARSWIERRRGGAGARLHLRLVLLFGLFAVVPTFAVSMVSGYWLSVSVREFVGEQIGGGLESGRLLAGAARDPVRAAMLRDVEEISRGLQELGAETVGDSSRAPQFLSRLSAGRPLVEATIVDMDGKVIASSIAIDSGITTATVPPAEALRRARTEAKPVIAPLSNGVYVILHLFSDANLFLVTGHAVDPALWFHGDRIERAQAFYADLDANLEGTQANVFAIYALIALLMLLSAVFMALTFASRLTEPIGGLMTAAERVRKGDLTARVAATSADDELGRLVRAFNRMTAQLDQQRRELVDANRELDQRRELTEAILAGVSAGVLSVDADGRIDRSNRSAAELLSIPVQEIEGRRLLEVMPELGDALETARARPDRLAQSQIDIARGGATRTLLVRIAAERADSGVRGFVVTFDDVSDLMSAQRMAAWADVARRIAHEIKNPLTPIQLSAERLKRRYLKQITQDPETFTICTDTIIRQVGDIGRMVDEFSSFARMPRPTLAEEDLKELCQQALFLQRNAQPQVAFTENLTAAPLRWRCDRRQIGQALTNLLKNAGEAIEGREPAADGARPPPGEISLTLTEGPDGAPRIVVEDNGRGLPKEGRARLTEPYVTTRGKGTGLGLAIVKKIMEDHGGALALDDREGGGARISLIFHRPDSDIRATPPAAAGS